jgi:hypothetical protein
VSVSFPHLAFWVIFPLAALIVLSSWILILHSAVQKRRRGKASTQDVRSSRACLDEPLPQLPDWEAAERTSCEGTRSAPLP